MYLLCSDGVSGMLDDDDILDAIANSDTVDVACRRLITRANQNGGEDNITALVFKIEGIGAREDDEFLGLSDTLKEPLESAIVEFTRELNTRSKH